MRFDDIIKNKLSAIEAPADAAAWNRFEARLSATNFDEVVKSKLENYEAPFDATAWNQVEAQIGGTRTTQFFGPLAAGIAATVLMTALFTSLPNMKPSDEMGADMEIITSDHEIPNEVSTSEVSFTSGHLPQEVHEINLTDGTLAETSATKPTSNRTEKGLINGNNNQTTTSGQQKTNSEVGMDKLKTETDQGDFSAKGIQCTNREIQFQAMLESKSSVTWIFDGIHVKEGLKTTFKFDSPGEHEARMTASFEDGTELKLTKKVMIYDNPSAQFQFQSDALSECFSVPSRLSTSPSENTYKWLIDGDTVGKGTELNKSLSIGTHNVGLLAINQEGCTSYTMNSVLVESSLLLSPPTAFSPSDANGLNDLWTVVGLENTLKFNLKIYKLGSKTPVFESTESPSWDGTMSGSSERPRSGDMFEWILVATDKCGETVQRSGSIRCL